MSDPSFDDIENMSDEDFMNMELPDYDVSSEAAESVEDEDEEGALAPESDEVETDELDEQEETDETDDAEEDDATEEEEETAENPAEESEAEDPLAELYKPFKANKREMAVTSIEEARTLMKMGANYSKKMAAIKPLTRVGHMLEKHGLMDEEKLSYLIDLHNKNPQAINKMIADSGIDPLDVNTEDSAEYKPKSYAPSDSEMVLDDVIREIEGTDSFTKTIDTVTKSWDKASSASIVAAPQELIHLNEQMGNGVFDLISGEVDRQRTFNGLVGLSDFEAYKKVGAELLERANAGQQQAAPKSESTQSKSKPVNKKRVAIPKKRTTTHTSNDLLELDALSNLSDEEFDKQFDKKFR